MDNLTARDIMTPNVPRVVVTDRPGPVEGAAEAGGICAVFARGRETRFGAFLGLANVPLARLEESATYSQLLRAGGQPPVSPEATASEVLGIMDTFDVPAVAVLDDMGAFLGIVARRTLFSALVQSERAEVASVEKRFQRSQNQYKALLAAFPDQVYVVTRDGRFVDSLGARENPNLFAVATMVGHTLDDVAPPADAAEFTEMLGAAFSTRNLQEREFSARTRDGMRNLEIRVIAFSSEEALVVARDVSDRRAAELAARESQILFEQFLQFSPTAVFIKDQDCRVLALSQHFETLLGRPASECIGLTNVELFPGELGQSMTRDDLQVMRNLEVTEVTEEYKGRTYHTVKFPIRREGRPCLLGGFTVDVTARRRADTEREAMQRLAQHLTPRLSIGEISHRLSREAHRLFRFDSYSFDLFTEGTKALRCIHRMETPDGEGAPVPGDTSCQPELTLGDEILERGDPLLLNDPDEAERRGLHVPPEGRRRSVSFMFAPVVWRDRVFALASVQSCIPNRYTSDDLELFFTLVGQCGGALARTLAEEDLRANRDELERMQMQYRAILRATPDGLCILGPDWTIRYANHAMHEIVNPTASSTRELIGLHLRAVFPSESEFRDYRRLAGSMTGSARGAMVERQLRRLNGQLFWCAISIVRLDPAQTAAGFVATLTDVSDRRRAEAALQDVSSRYQMLVEQSLAGIFIRNRTELLYVNDRTAAIFGYSKEDMTSGDPFFTVHPDDLAIVEAGIGSLFGGGKTASHFQARGVARGGHIVYMDVQAMRIDYEGEPTVIGMVLDMTAQRMAEREREFLSRLGLHLAGVKTREEMAEMVARETRELWDWDSFGFNVRNMDHDSFLRILGIDTDENGALESFAPEEHRSLFAFPERDFWRGEPSLYVGDSVPSSPGSTGWGFRGRKSASQIIAPIQVDEQVLGYITMGTYTEGSFDERDRDFLGRIAKSLGPALERCRAENETRRLALAVEQSSEAVVIADPDWSIRHVNPAFERISGHLRGDVLGFDARKVPEIVDRGDSYLRAMDAVLARGEPWSGTLTCSRADGTVYEDEVRISPVRDDTGSTVSYVLVRRDITRDRQIETQLRQSQKMESFGLLAGYVAHDFNNLLTIILGNGQALVDGRGGSREAEAVLAAARRGNDLTRQLLAFSRKQKAEVRVVNLNEVANSTSRMVGRLLGANIHVDLILDPDLPPVYADPGQMNQVLMNLLLNARDAMPHGGVIRVETMSVRADETGAQEVEGLRPVDYACLSVSDNGTGMDEKIRERIFEPFFTTKGEGKGTGLGLAMVYNIVNQSGGLIAVASRPGEGSTFRVFVPAGGDPDDLEDTSSDESSLTGGTETILIVEDESEVRQLEASILASVGYEVLQARNGPEALRILEACGGGVRLLLSDVQMPEMDGVQLFRRVRAVLPRLRTLFISGYADDSTVQDALAEPGVGYLQKPVTPDRLVRRVRDMLDRLA